MILSFIYAVWYIVDGLDFRLESFGLYLCTAALSKQFVNFIDNFFLWNKEAIINFGNTFKEFHSNLIETRTKYFWLRNDEIK